MGRCWLGVGVLGPAASGRGRVGWVGGCCGVGCLGSGLLGEWVASRGVEHKQYGCWGY
jgi:hypothetical protein